MMHLKEGSHYLCPVSSRALRPVKTIYTRRSLYLCVHSRSIEPSVILSLAESLRSLIPQSCARLMVVRRTAVARADKL